MSRRKLRGRPVHGILLLDKPSGLSSNKVLQIAKRLFDAQKAGHTGSLDPLATGMLPICFGEATKVSQYLLDADKVYEVRFKLGERSSTGDAEGEIIETRPADHVTEALIQRTIAQFIGEIDQVPPMYSALKHDGQRLYELARKGVEVERKSRRVTIYSIDFLGFNAGEVELCVACSKGTYIRTLAEDIAEAMDTVSYVTRLHRVEVGSFSGFPMVGLDELEKRAEEGHIQLDKVLLPVDTGIQGLAELGVNDDLAYYLKLGQAVQVPGAPTEGLVRLYNQARFLGIGTVLDDGRIAPKRMMNL